MAETAFLQDLLKLLSINKGYPKYQHERRIDLFVNYFLPWILKAAFGSPIDLVVPEFPLKKASSKLSTNADYLAFSARDKLIFLCEFKTTHRSFELDQMERYYQAQKTGWLRVLADVAEVSASTSQENAPKYIKLLDTIRAIPSDVTLRVVYIAPEATRPMLHEAASGRDYSFLSLESLHTLDIESPFKEEWLVVRSSI
jgi:hypothetical protein